MVRTQDPSRFTGPVYRSAAASKDDDVDLVTVRFEPGVRTVPHTHSVDQVLYAEAGSGIVQTGDQTIDLRPGDWAVIPAGVVHWHGASGSREFVQVALKFGGSTDWAPPDAGDNR
jgi:quercetin dioxygenase-like cupin family protein